VTKPSILIDLFSSENFIVFDCIRMQDKRSRSMLSLPDASVPKRTNTAADYVPSEPSDFDLAPRPKGPKPQGRSNQRRGKGTADRQQTARREYGNKKFQATLDEHFNTILNMKDETYEAFSFVGNQGDVVSPPRAIEIETASVVEVIDTSINIAMGKVKPGFFDPEFRDALVHVTACQVSSKLAYAHLRSPLGNTTSEVIPETHSRLERVRLSANTTFKPVILYLDQVGNFEHDGTIHVPYLRGLKREDSASFWPPDITKYHCTDQLYSRTVRESVALAPPDICERLISMGIPIGYPTYPPLPLGFEGPSERIVVVPPGRDLVMDCDIVNRNFDRLVQKFPKLVGNFVLDGGRGSVLQSVVTAPAVGFESDTVWSPLPLPARDLYIGASLRFCIDDGHVPPWQHPGCKKHLGHFVVRGAIQRWIGNFMSRS